MARGFATYLKTEDRRLRTDFRRLKTGDGRLQADTAKTVGALALVALTTWAGFWQLYRAQEKIEIGERLQQIRAAPPLSIAAGEIDPADYDLRRIIAEGVFDRASTIYLDNKVRQGTAGYEVI